MGGFRLPLFVLRAPSTTTTRQCLALSQHNLLVCGANGGGTLPLPSQPLLLAQMRMRCFMLSFLPRSDQTRTDYMSCSLCWLLVAAAPAWKKLRRASPIENWHVRDRWISPGPLPIIIRRTNCARHLRVDPYCRRHYRCLSGPSFIRYSEYADGGADYDDHSTTTTA